MNSAIKSEGLFRYGIIITLSLWAVLTLCGESQAQSLDTSLSVDPYSSDHGAVWIRMADGSGYTETLPLETSVDMQVSGVINRVHVRQAFLNNTQLWAEAVYVFPLPENAAVDHMTLYVDGRVIEGQILAREQASEVFETAKVEGSTAGLVKQHKANVFSLEIANIAPGEQIIVEIDYLQTLEYQNDEFSLRFPLSIAPRLDATCTHNQSCDALDPRPIRIVIDLDPGFSVKSLISTTHDIDVKETDHSYRIRMQSQSLDAWKDFSLQWRGDDGVNPDVTVYGEVVDGQHYGLLMIMPPRVEVSAFESVPRELTLVIDVSGSMTGVSLDSAKSAVILALKTLSQRDSFNVIAFNDQAYSFYPKPVTASTSNIEAAINFVDNMQASGGTNMHPAIDLAFRNSRQDDNLRQVVFMTDGGVGDEDALFSAIQQGLSDRRLFTVGIGSAPNAYFMRKAARNGRGTFTFISDSSEVKAKMSALLERLSSPVLTDLKLKNHRGAIEILPNPLPDLYLGEPVVAVWSGDTQGQPLHISGIIDGLLWERTIHIDRAAVHPGVAKTWARMKLDQLKSLQRQSDTEGKSDQFEIEMTKLAIDHQLMSAYTSFVAVDITPRRAGGLMKSHDKNPELSSEWKSVISSAQGYAINLPQTASNAPLHALLALIALTLALVFARIWKRGWSCANWG